MALLGALSQEFLPGLLPAIFLVFSAMVLAAYVSKVYVSRDIGMTTAVATLLTFVHGSMATHSETGLTLAVVLGTLTTALLAAKRPIHSFASRISREEMVDTAKFLIIALVVLPLLPD